MTSVPSAIDPSIPIGSVDDLVAYFRSGEKPPSAWRIGTEHEKIGVYTTGDLSRVPYEGDRGIGVVLERVAQLEDWERVYEGGNLIALLKDGASITLEPGGQIELSGAPLRTLRETCAEFNAHVDLLKRASEGLDIAWLALGADPISRLEDIPRMPKSRYAIMRSYLPSKGELALHMMHATATVQANYDYESEADMAAKMRTAMGCSPLVSALFANSPFSEGRENGFATRRVEIWRFTDPDRCGVLPFVFDEGFGYRDYAEWALDVPMFFLVRDHEYRALQGTTFREFMSNGIGEERAMLADWDLHLTTLFPEVRLKRFIEVRGADGAARAFICALPAIWKGLLYDAEARAAAWEIVADWSLAEREGALGEVARRGLAAEIGGRKVLDAASELVSIASEGLRRIAERGETDADERSFLEPLVETLARGQSPAHELLDRWRGEWQRDPRRLIEDTRY